MSKSKYLISKGLSLSRYSINRNPKMTGSWPDPVRWSEMNRAERINFSVGIFNPESPIVAYYKGVGLFGRHNPELYGKSIAALNRALQLTNGKFWSASLQLAKIYAKEKNYNMAWQVLLDAVRNLHDSIKADVYSIKEITDLMLFNVNESKYEKKPLPHGLPNEHFEEIIWLHCWNTSKLLAQGSEFKDAYETLIRGKKYLESALANDKFDLDFLKQNLDSSENLDMPTSTVAKYT